MDACLARDVQLKLQKLTEYADEVNCRGSSLPLAIAAVAAAASSGAACIGAWSILPLQVAGSLQPGMD